MKYRSIRSLTALAAGAAVTALVSSASAVTCNLPFPIEDGECSAGSSFALVQHFLLLQVGEFQFAIDMRGGSTFAFAYGIDEDGNALDDPETTVADGDDRLGQFAPVPSDLIYPGTTGEITQFLSYDHPVDMASTFVFVL